ncbi:short-chain dehydrogenases protein [Diplodia corticola]|uniref:Short-chain dehydrogenases protein n=1 Tax=Diplodia corticola TaxID=236234 RepID=A0A1J9RPH6_9PEZI|nr:short-chain dehydrogenases protein [Diplodia corticola]OJD30367.1 short-chain dehydrogenases protein [Diplodia corticola]
MPSDPRVTAVDAFTPTTHTTPGPTLLAALSPAPNSPPLSTILILGASRGIGAGIALSYARAATPSTTLILAARTLSPALSSVAAAARAAAAAATPHGGAITVLERACDVASAQSVAAVAAWVRDEVLGSGSGGDSGQRQRRRLDVVVFNPGYSGPVELAVTDGDALDGEWERAFAVNALGTYYAAHYFVPLLLADRAGGGSGGGRKAFLVVGSVAGCIRRGVIANSKYCVSKMAQARIVEHLAEQFGGEAGDGDEEGRGLLAMAVHPGAVETDTALETAPEAFRKYLVDDPELCGHFLVWLTREPGRFRWLNGRLVSATWDPDELLAKKDEIIAGDLLKFEVKTG